MTTTAMQEASRILAIRHGETDWNASGRIQGHLDIELNARGRRQAARLAHALLAEVDAQPIHAIYSSDLRRARATAQPLADALALPLETETGLRERSFGLFEGRTFDEIVLRWPHDAERWRRRDVDFAPPCGGESLRAFRTRVLDCVTALAARHAGAQLVLVTHGGVLDVLYRAATRQSLDAPRSWQLGNAAVNRLLWTPQGFSLVGWDDTRHLIDEPKDEPAA